MAHHKSALKRIRQTEKRRLRNRMYKSRMKTAIRRVREAETKEAAMEALKQAYAVIDKLVSKGVIPRNRAANKKSRLTRFVNSMA
ncbi:MAG: 30S ribosomal protein S20 [Calditrichaeota bacterium]|nr:MAG: 30S ribosomal protein S20 [Calditrichota bacterium]